MLPEEAVNHRVVILEATREAFLRQLCGSSQFLLSSLQQIAQGPLGTEVMVQVQTIEGLGGWPIAGGGEVGRAGGTVKRIPIRGRRKRQQQQAIMSSSLGGVLNSTICGNRYRMSLIIKYQAGRGGGGKSPRVLLGLTSLLTYALTSVGGKTVSDDITVA